MSLAERQPAQSGRRSNLSFYAIFLLVIGFFIWLYVPDGWLPDDAVWPLDLLFFLSWIGMPIAVYADVRTVRAQDVEWQPKAPFWILGCVLPGVNVSVVIPYLLRRYERVNRRESWEYWWRIAGLGVGLFLLVVVVDILLFDLFALESALLDAALGEIGAFVLVFSAVLVPMAVKYDIAFVERHFDWEPETALWVAGSAIPLLNIVVVFSYVAKRNPEAPFSVLDDADTGSPGTETDVPGGDRSTEDRWGSDAREEAEREGGQTPGNAARSVTAADVDSNWWYWPAITTGLTGFTILVGIGVVTAFVTDALSIGLPLIALFVLLLVALALVGYGSILAIYYDANAIRETDANWQPAVVGYVFAAVLISPLVPAIVYVVQRHRHLGEP